MTGFCGDFFHARNRGSAASTGVAIFWTWGRAAKEVTKRGESGSSCTGQTRGQQGLRNSEGAGHPAEPRSGAAPSARARPNGHARCRSLDGDKGPRLLDGMWACRRGKRGAWGQRHDAQHPRACWPCVLTCTDWLVSPVYASTTLPSCSTVADPDLHATRGTA